METESESITDLLNGTPPPENPAEPTVEAPVEPEAPEKAAETEGEKPEATPETSEGEKGAENTGETPSPEVKTEEPETIPFAAFRDERRKRQELDRRTQDLERRLQEASQAPTPDPIEDPEAFVAHQDTVRQNERIQDRIAMSEQLVRTQVGDEEFTKAQDAFVEEAMTNPALAVELRDHPNPAKFAYDTGKAALERQEIGDPREFAAKQVKEALEKQQATMAAEITKQVQEQVAKLVPTSLADAQSAGGRSTQTPVEDVDVPIADLLPK